jgi:hypothetical protein
MVLIEKKQKCWREKTHQIPGTGGNQRKKNSFFAWNNSEWRDFMRQYKILLASALALALGLSNFAKAGGHEGPHDQGMHAERPPQCDEAEEALRSMGVEPGALAQVAFSEMPPPEGSPEGVVAAFDDMLDAKVAAVFFGGDEEAAKAMFDRMDQFDVNPMDCGYFPPGMTKEMME